MGTSRSDAGCLHRPVPAGRERCPAGVRLLRCCRVRCAASLPAGPVLQGPPQLLEWLHEMSCCCPVECTQN